MNNYRRAPKLYHIGKKDTENFYLLPKNLMIPIFNQLNGKQGNQLKLMSVLIGTAGNGSFAVSEKWICNEAGMDQSNYNRARKALIDRGWLKLDKGCLSVDFAAICSLPDDVVSSHADDMRSELETCDDNVGIPCDDDGYNKEKNK